MPTCFDVETSNGVAHLRLSRPDELNTMNVAFWAELPELVAETLADYERLAIAIGRQPLRAASYKRYLAEQGRSSPLFDMPSIVRSIESHFERLALKHRA